MIIFRSFSEIAIVNLCADILFEKGPMYLGEIGKAMTRTLSIANFSSIVKENFGGYKKLLGRYSDRFIVPEYDVNPKVMLRKRAHEISMGSGIIHQPAPRQVYTCFKMFFL
jgi:hypothetical protein